MIDLNNRANIGIPVLNPYGSAHQKDHRWTEMWSIYPVSLILSILSVTVVIATFSTENSPRSRRKRYLVFPEGASLSVALCMTSQTYIPTQIFTQAINWGIAYDLPNDTSVFRNYLYPKHVMKRRHRRDLYQKVEVIIDSMGYNGRSCILRALCEAARRFVPNGNNLLEELLRIVFDFPQQKVLASEPEEHRLYHWAGRIGKEDLQRDCTDLFPKCPFSLVDMALGEYTDYGHTNPAG